EVGLARQRLKAGDLHLFTRRVRGRQVVFGLQLADGLGVLEPLGKGEDQDRVQPVDRFAMPLQQGRGQGYRVGHRGTPNVWLGVWLGVWLSVWLRVWQAR